jgi:hypothetical protein
LLFPDYQRYYILHFQDKAMPSKKAATKPGFTTLSASSDDNPRTKEDDPRIDDNDFDLKDNNPRGSGDPTDDEQPKSPKMGFTNVVQHVVDLCKFTSKSIMVEYIASQEWAKLHHITMIRLDEVNHFHIVKNDGKFLAKPLKHQLCTFQCFLLYYKRKCRKINGPLDEYDVLTIQKSDF